MNHCVLAGYAGYDKIYKVENFVRSWDKTMSDTSDLIIVYDNDNEVSKWIREYIPWGPGQIFTIRTGVVHNNPYLNRFQWFAETLTALDYTYILAADIRDVVFQKNVFQMVTPLPEGKTFIACDEGIDHREEWNNTQLTKGFPDFAKSMLKKNVMNCGVILGEREAVQKVCQMIYDFGSTANQDYSEKEIEYLVICDQPAYSILVHTTDLQHEVLKATNKDPFCCTIATISLTEKEIYLVNGQLCNGAKEPYAIVHQYDRVAGMIDYDKEMLVFFHETQEVESKDDSALQVEGKRKKLYDLTISCHYNVE